MSNFIKKPNNEYKLRKDKHWDFKQMVEHFSRKPFEQVVKEYELGTNKKR